MISTDSEALARLLPYLHEALAAQAPHVRDQLDAAVRDGRTALRFEQSGTAPVVVITVAGQDLLEVDIRNLLGPDAGPGDAVE